MSVDRETLEHLGELARLHLDEGQREEMTAQLATIVEYVAQLESVDVSDVPPTAAVGGPMTASQEDGPDRRRGERRLRDDEPGPCLSQERALSNAPDADEGHFLVPRVLPDE